MAYQVNSGECISCGACQEVCPVECIRTINDLRYIDESQCISCGSCANMCPVKCIKEV